MPDLNIEKPVTLDLLDTPKPGTSVTSDMPVIETHPDSKPKPHATQEKHAAPDKAETTEDTATSDKPADTAAAPDGKPKAPSGVQKRIDELTRQREDERRARLATEERLEKAMSLLERAMTGKAVPEQSTGTEDDPEPAEPDVAKYTDQEKYNSDYRTYLRTLSRWEGRQEVKRFQSRQSEESQKRQQEERQRTVLETYHANVKKAREKYPDYDTIANDPTLPITREMSNAIIQTEHGPEIVIHLANNREEAARISKLSPEGQIMELGYLTAQFRQAAKETAPTRPSAAPKPITPIRSGASAAAVISAQEEDMNAYAARRQKELEAQRRPAGRR